MSPDSPTSAPATPPSPPEAPRKRRRLLRWTLGILLTLVVLVLLLAGLAWYGVSSESGTRVLLTRLGGLVPGELTVGSQRGPLTGPLELRDVHYRTADGMDVRLKRVELDWDEGKLRRRQLDVQRLRAEGIRITLPPAKEEDETEDGKLVDIHLPVNIIVRDALIRDVEVVRAGQPPFRLDEIALDARSERQTDVLHVRSLRVDGPTFKLRAHGDLNPVGDYPVNLQAQATYDDAQYPPFVVAGTFTGTLEKLGVNARLTQPFDARVTGNVLTPMRELGMDLSAQVRGFEAKEINAEWPVARITQGNVKIKGKLDDFVSEGKVAGAYEDYGSGEATYRLARRGEDFIFEYLNLRTEDGAALNARGTIGMGETGGTGDKDLALDVIADWRGLAWPPTGGPLLVASRSGEAKIRGTLADYQLDLDAHLAGPDIPPGRWVLAGRGSKEKMDIRSLRGDVLRGRLAAAGTVSWKPQVTWRVRLSGDGLDPGVQYPQWPGRISFAATSDGVLRDAGPYGRVDVGQLSGNLQGNPVAGVVHLEMMGDRYRLPRLDLRSGTARVTAAGTFGTKPELSWQGRLAGEGIDPSVLQPEWPGNLAFNVASNGALRGGNPYGRVDLTDLRGNLRGNPVAGVVHLEMMGERYRLPQLDLRSGTTRATASGTFSKTAGDLDWRLQAPNLAEALPDATGSLMAAGHVSGPWKTPRVQAKADGQSIAYQTYSVETVALTANVDLASNGPMVIDLDAAKVGLDERRFDTVTLDGRGTRRAHEVALAVRATEGSFDLALAGGLAGTTPANMDWSGEIRRLDLANEQTGTWRLAGPAGLAAGATAAALRDFCWVSADNNARVCAQGQWAKTGPWNASGTIADLPFAMFKPFLPSDLEITGGVNGSFQGQSAPNGFVTANVDLRPGPGEVRYPTESGQTARVRFDQGTVTLTAGQNGLASRLAMAFPETGRVEADLRLPQYNKFGTPLQQQSVGGRIVASFTNLGLLEAFSPDLKNPKGVLDADLALSGTVAAPRATGSAELRGAQVDVPKFGLEVRQIGLTARSDGQGVLQLQGSARSGGGNLTIGGNVPLDKRPSRITVDGRRFVVSDTPEAKVFVSPNLQIAMEYPRVDVTGDVEIPEASIGQPKKGRRAAIPVSQDVYIVPPSEEGAETPKEQLALHARIRVILGDKVVIKEANGFSGKPTGSVLVIEEPGKITTAVGELEVKDGIYKSYGQDLTLDRGRVIFAGGPVDNPGLDLRAYRKADDGVVAGLNIKGTLRAPETTIYSDPPMGQSEALAYILLGHPLGQASPQEGNLLANAANSLGLKGGNMVAKRLAARYGLEEARIESTGGLKEASLVVGKYLSPRLYVTYGLGLFEPISTFRIRYILGREWTLQAEQGSETGADILYTVERGKGGATPAPVKDKGEDVQGPTGTTTEGGGSGGRP
ncbi:MAG TPA: translocation/assembly module TamB domain-containing protein [Thermoanaerobaculia bacterium]|nr:translocation/assembly module TamB domain-containing protein [Thermoanaerobaculia bacterium]